MSQFHVCVVDDDFTARMIAVDALSGLDYRITECETGAACLELFDGFDDLPDMVLLDIEMPGLDGYEVCRRLRESGNERVQVIFVSGRDDLDSRLAGFDVGGSDFIVKPYAPKELRYHVMHVAEHASRQQAVAAQLSFAQKTAFSAMSSMGEMGAVLQFMRDSFACNSMAELADKIFTALTAYELTALLCLHDGHADHRYAGHGECTELEISILDYIRKLPRLQQLGQRLVVNYPHATLLVLDLPLHDTDKVERLRDHLAIVAEGADARVVGLIAESARIAQTQGIVDAVAGMGATFKETDALTASNREAVMKVVSSFDEKLIYAFLGMGLTASQENQIAELAQTSMDEIAELLANQALLDQRLKEVAFALEHLVTNAD